MAIPVPHVNRNIYLKCLLYGNPGSGKTTLAGSAVNHPMMAKVLFLSIEGGMLSIPSHPDVLYEELRNKGKGGGGVLAKVEKYFWDLAAQKEEWTKGVKTVVLDSGTELLTLALESIVEERGGTIDAIFIQDYGKSTASLKRLFRYFRDLPMNVIVTALAQDIMEGKGEAAYRVGIEPAFTSKLRESVKGVFDHVWYTYKTMESDEEAYHILTRSKGLHFGKTRGKNFSPALGMKVTNPTLPQIYDLLQKSEGDTK